MRKRRWNLAPLAAGIFGFSIAVIILNGFSCGRRCGFQWSSSSEHDDDGDDKAEQQDEMEDYAEPTDEAHPIDAVITHVRLDDPHFALLLNKHKRESRLKHSQTENRFEDHRDLLYLLRSIDLYGGMFRHVHLVLSMESQVPAWLNRNHEKLTVVFHHQLWSNLSHLPVFNSFAVEANLHRIPGLSETFVYFNDDLALTNEVVPEDFTWRSKQTGKPLAFLIRSDSLVLPRTFNRKLGNAHWLGPAVTTKSITREACLNKQGRSMSFGRMPKHAPHLLIRPVLQAAAGHPAFADYFDVTSASRFRSGYEINPVMMHNAYAECYLNYTVLHGDSRLEAAYIGLNRGSKDTSYPEKMLAKMEMIGEAIKAGQTKFVCLNDITDSNDVTDNGSLVAAAAYNWRRALFPEKSAFEI